MVGSWSFKAAVAVQSCINNDESQFFFLSPNGEIKRDNLCFDYSSNTPNVIPFNCHGQKGTQV
jgi:hypothetical protein